MKVVGLASGLLVAALAAVVARMVFSGPRTPVHGPPVPPSAPAATTPAAPASTPAASASAAPPLTVRTYALATFGKNGLSECAEFTGAKDTYTRNLAAVSGGNMKPIERPCREQFSDRVALASCREDPERVLKIVRWYYDASVLSDGAYRKECLGEEGEWKESAGAAR